MALAREVQIPVGLCCSDASISARLPVLLWQEGRQVVLAPGGPQRSAPTRVLVQLLASLAPHVGAMAVLSTEHGAWSNAATRCAWARERLPVMSHAGGCSGGHLHDSTSSASPSRIERQTTAERSANAGHCPCISSRSPPRVSHARPGPFGMANATALIALSPIDVDQSNEGSLVDERACGEGHEAAWASASAANALEAAAAPRDEHLGVKPAALVEVAACYPTNADDGIKVAGSSWIHYGERLQVVTPPRECLLLVL